MKRLVICIILLISFLIIDVETQESNKIEAVRVIVVGGGPDSNKELIRTNISIKLIEYCENGFFVLDVDGDMKPTNLVVVSLDSVANKVLFCVREYLLLPDDVLSPAAQRAFADEHITSTPHISSLHYLSDVDKISETSEEIAKNLADSFNQR